MSQTKHISKLKQLSARRAKLMEKVNGLDAQINAILENVQTRKAVAKQDHPRIGSGPYKLCKAMSSRAKSKEEIAQKTGLTVGTVTLYLHQFDCFRSAGRGKGYVYIKPKAGKK